MVNLRLCKTATPRFQTLTPRLKKFETPRCKITRKKDFETNTSEIS